MNIMFLEIHPFKGLHLKILNTPILGVATPISLDGQRVHIYDCALCAEKGMNQTELYTHLRQMHNMVRGEFDQIPVTEENGREVVSAEDSNLQLRIAPAPRRSVLPGEPAEGGEGPVPEEGGAAGEAVERGPPGEAGVEGTTQRSAGGVAWTNTTKL